jgi:calcium/proton exchanger cax
LILLIVTVAVAVESELLVASLEEATEELGLTALFTGVILLPIIGNAAEHATAVTVALKNKMDLSVSVVCRFQYADRPVCGSGFGYHGLYYWSAHGF